ncbi:MAG: hypothetical protein U5R48_13580 [Gammaproteobacteria bacterium]|nr:hypothetical protein [Gammaproteobacteria bacterium]
MAFQVPALFWSWVILLGVFIVDATTTLFARTRRRARLSEAHRSHAYQYAARRLGRHWPVSAAVVAINLCWLLPLALAAAGRMARWLVRDGHRLPAAGAAGTVGWRAGAAEMQEE